jgi:outer membrane protein OmpA-like peptidoglycan-associated protein
VRVVAPLTSPSPGPGATPLKAPAVTLAVNAGKVTLTGAVPSEQVKTTLGDSATATFGAGAVDNQLTVDAQVGADGLSGLGGVLDGLGKDAQGAAVSLADGVITLTGTVGSAAAKQAAVGAAGQVAGSADRVRDQLTVVAPPAPPAQVQNKLSSLPPIGFLTGSATLSPSGRTAVAQVAAVLNANPSTRIRIEGHTDDVGDASRNLVLSRSRAAVVLNTLRAGGVAADRMTSTGFGEARPKVRGTSEAARATNRRVEFIVV